MPLSTFPRTENHITSIVVDGLEDATTLDLSAADVSAKSLTLAVPLPATSIASTGGLQLMDDGANQYFSGIKEFSRVVIDYHAALLPQLKLRAAFDSDKNLEINYRESDDVFRFQSRYFGNGSDVPARFLFEDELCVNTRMTVGNPEFPTNADLEILSNSTKGTLNFCFDNAGSVLNGDVLGTISFTGRDYNSTRTGANIVVSALGGWSNSSPSQNRAPTRMEFFIEDGLQDAATVARVIISYEDLIVRVNSDFTLHNGTTSGLHLGGVLVQKTAAQLNAAPDPDSTYVHNAGWEFVETPKIPYRSSTLDSITLGVNDGLVVYSGTGDKTWYLPSYLSVDVGQEMTIINKASSGNLTVKWTTSDISAGARILTAGGLVTSVVIAPNGVLKLISLNNSQPQYYRLI